MKRLFKYNTLTFLLLILLTFGLIYLTNHYVLTAGFYEANDDLLSGIPNQENSVYQSLQKWIYISSAVYLLVKLVTISLVLYTGLYFADQEIKFRDVFNIVILSDYIFLIPAVVKIIWFHAEYPNGTLAQWDHFYILSILSFFDSAPADMTYFLQTINVFEFGYWFLLAFGIYRYSKLDYDGSLRVVISSYLPALFIWICIVSFCIIMVFPNVT